MASLNSRATSSREKIGGTFSLGSGTRPTGSHELSTGSTPPLAIRITQEVDKSQASITQRCIVLLVAPPKPLLTLVSTGLERGTQ